MYHVTCHDEVQCSTAGASFVFPVFPHPPPSFCLSLFLSLSLWLSHSDHCCLGTSGFLTVSPWRPCGEGHSLRVGNVWRSVGNTRQQKAADLCPVCLFLGHSVFFFFFFYLLFNSLAVCLNKYSLQSLFPTIDLNLGAGLLNPTWEITDLVVTKSER